jgi:diguanylate cyclase
MAISDLVQEQLRKLLVEIVNAVELTIRNFSSSETKLENIKATLAQNLSLKKVDQIVDFVKQEIKRLESNSASLQEQLRQATDEIDQLKTKMVQYREESLIDPLTRIYNRRGFSEELETAIKESTASGTTLCVIIADIDHFKKVNDTYGHIVGDNVLRIVSKTIKESIKGKDLIARVGGEEFALLLPDTPFEGAMAVAENLRSIFNQLDLRKKDSRASIGKISLSFGVACYMADEVAESFIKRADEALYYSKKSGRNKVTGL